MSTFVLVHGGWQGASTWDLIVPQLQRSGHRVFTPVLTGVGADSHRLSPAVNLDTHIEDVTGLLEGEGLQEITLVGHSYAGMVITAVAEREIGRLSRLVYVDAFVPGDSESALDLLPESIQKSFREQARANGGGGGCQPVKPFWISGAYNLAPLASMSVRGSVISVCDASNRQFGCRRMRPQCSRGSS